MGEPGTGGSDTSARQDPLVGRRLASYEVLARVARGGMGVVYRARHVYIDKIVALKVLDPALAQRADLIERFRTEAQSLARVEHENVVKVIDILEDKGVHFIVMDFAEGTNLRVLVKEKGQLSGDELLSIARQTAEALYAAHREGILHRDIKPENLILNARGRCKLADFGLAGDLRLISEGHEGPLNFGTPAYSAPEVMRRMVPDKRSDIFSFGATLYFLATGEPPFGQTGAQQIMLRQKQGAELLDARRADLPGKFNQLIMDCIHYHPKDRPGSFIEVLDRLPKRMVTRGVSGTATAPTDATDPSHLTTGTHETTEAAPGPKPLLIGAAALGAVAVAVVLFLLLRPLFSGGDNQLSAVNEPTPVNQPVNRPPANLQNRAANAASDDGFAIRPEDEAFNAAELDSRTALGNADYRGAYAAWGGFIAAYPKSDYVVEARTRQAELVRRVADLRVHEYDKAKQASDEALKEFRMADALAALNRFPKELLEPLGDADDVAVASRIETQRQIVLGIEAGDLAKLLEKAESFRSDWQKDRANPALDEIRRLRSAGNLLRERDLLDAFLAGRTAETQTKVEARLAELRRVLETTHQQSQQEVEDWRAFHDETLSQWADRALKRIESLATLLSNRNTKAALKLLETELAELEKLQSKAASDARRPELAEKARGARFVRKALETWRDELLVADRVSISLEDSLREVRTAGTTREFLVHAEIDAAGVRSTRVDRYTGRVVSTSSTDCVVDDDGTRVTIAYSMLTVASLRKLVSSTDSHEAQVALITWLVAIGRADEAEAEFPRLERMESAPAETISRVRASISGKSLAPDAVLNLTYLAMRGGASDLKLAPGSLPAGSLHRRLADAQLGVARGDKQAFDDYLAAVHEVVDPELVHLETFALAAGVAAGVLTDGQLQAWTAQLEPRNPAAWAALAERAAGREPVRAREYAGRALILDGSNEAAWKVLAK